VLIIFIYIAIRFRNWQFGLGTLVALFHDVFFVVSCFAIARLFGLSFEIDEIFIAALLTLVGYSVNDTVVVFDFIRDYIDDKNLTFKEIINKSLNNTMSRTIMTSLTVLFVVLALFIFGGDALRGFSFALLVGVLVGTYSSLFIATPLVYDTTKGKGKEEE
jgi:SecD/SecF fusion protein